MSNIKSRSFINIQLLLFPELPSEVSSSPAAPLPYPVHTCHHALQRRWKDEKSPALSVLRTDTLYLPYRYDFVSDTVKC